MLCMLCFVTSKINKIIRIQTFFDLFLKFGEQPEIISNQKQKRARKYASSWLFFVPGTRFELAHRNRHHPLKVACLPISPSGLDFNGYKDIFFILYTQLFTSILLYGIILLYLWSIYIIITKL